MVLRSWIVFLWVALCAVTVLLVVVSIKYFIVPPEHLPTIFPGSLRPTGMPRYKVHHLSDPERRNGAVAAILASISFFGVYWIGSRLINEST